MTEKTRTITYIDGTPSLEVEAESLVKAVEKVNDKLPSEDLSGADFSCANLKAANLIGADLIEAKGLPEIRLTLTQQLLKKHEIRKQQESHNP